MHRRAVLAITLTLASVSAFAAELRPFTVDTMWAVKRVGVPPR